MLAKHASRFHLAVLLNQKGYTIVDFKKDGSDTGLYLKNWKNEFNTPLAARGTREDIHALVKEYVPDAKL